jgi:hypothetical protein
MADNKGGWPVPDDPAKSMADYNRRAFLSNFPPEKRWDGIMGVLFQDRPELGDSLVSITGRDHKGEYTTIWVDLPNAMYLMAMLSGIQRDTKANVPLTEPGSTKPHTQP